MQDVPIWQQWALKGWNFWCHPYHILCHPLSHPSYKSVEPPLSGRVSSQKLWQRLCRADWNWDALQEKGAVPVVDVQRQQRFSIIIMSIMTENSVRQRVKFNTKEQYCRLAQILPGHLWEALNSRDFRSRRKTDVGREFQTRDADIGKARSPSVDHRV